MTDFNELVNDFIKEALEIRERIIIKNVCDDVEEHPEFYGDVKKYEITREQILDTLNKGAMYDELEKKYKAVDGLITDIRRELLIARAYNLSSDFVFRRLEGLLDDFDSERN